MRQCKAPALDAVLTQQPQVVTYFETMGDDFELHLRYYSYLVRRTFGNQLDWVSVRHDMLHLRVYSWCFLSAASDFFKAC